MACFCYIDGNVPKEFVVFLLGSVGLMQERSEPLNCRCQYNGVHFCVFLFGLRFWELHNVSRRVL